MTVCKTCNGLGKIKLMPFGYICTCAECKGTGEIRDYMTNEEWFNTLSTEEKAKVFANATYSTAEAPLSILLCGKEAEQKKWEKWLKQPRTTKE